MPSYPSGVHTAGAAQYPYDDPSMIPLGSDGLERLATRAALMSGAGLAYCATTTDRDALVTNGDAFAGLVTYVADVDQYQQYDGTAWTAIAGAWTAGTLTAATSVTLSSGSFIRQLGNRVSMHVQATRSSAWLPAVGASVPILTVPTDMAPSDFAVVTGVVTSGPAPGAIACYLDSTGAMAARWASGTSASQLQLAFDLEYFTD